MKFVAWFLPLTFVLPAVAQKSAQSPDPWQTVSFLFGTWEAKTGAGSDAKVAGTYVFQKELKGHVVARHSTTANCSGPEAFDCQHSDLLYLFQDEASGGLKAIYFDNEGHVLHYAVSTPNPSTAEFLSEPGPGPRFRLIYHLEGAIMAGKFQMQAPGQDSWKSYLEWSGAKQ